jgi:mRNA interferase MazF
VIYDRFDVVKVPFPFTDKQSSKVRPALVLSNAEFNRSVGKTIFAMITSTTKTTWLHDTVVTDLSTAGLTVPSRVRMKIFTIDNGFILKRLGRLSVDDRQEFEKNFENLTSQKR